MPTTLDLPDLPLAQWQPTRTTLHLLTQIVGKVRLALQPRQHHWWHATLYVTPRGLSTGAVPHPGGLLEIELDLLAHRLQLRTSGGDESRFPLAGQTIAGCYRRLLAELAARGIQAGVRPQPYDPDRVGRDVPFAEDTAPAPYDPDFADRFRRVLVAIEPVFQAFRGRFLGKCSPVHFFWHSFDLAVTRFSGRPAAVAADADPVSREAYSHEVISAGFWPGDDNVPEPAFYAYAAPEPAGLAAAQLQPPAARWQDNGGSHLALYRYADFRRATDPPAALLQFLQSSYDAGAEAAGWPEFH